MTQPQSGGESSASRNAAIIALVLAIIAVLAVGTWALLRGAGREDGSAAAQETSTRNTPSSVATTPNRPSSSSEVSVAPEAPTCNADVIAQQFDAEVRVRDCIDQWAVLMIPQHTPELGLYRWAGQRWELFADPLDGTCREELAEVPLALTRDFPPCQTQSPSASSSTSTASDAEPGEDAAPAPSPEAGADQPDAPPPPGGEGGQPGTPSDDPVETSTADDAGGAGDGEGEQARGDAADRPGP